MARDLDGSARLGSLPVKRKTARLKVESPAFRLFIVALRVKITSCTVPRHPACYTRDTRLGRQARQRPLG
jgi:hypothetical protein